MKTLDIKKIEEAALTYYKHQQATKEKHRDFAEMLEYRINRMEIFTNQIFSIAEVKFIKKDLGIIEAFCEAFSEPEELNHLNTFLIDFTCICQALISTPSHIRYKLIVSENSIGCQQY
jgi:hypothetical protein